MFGECIGCRIGCETLSFGDSLSEPISRKPCSMKRQPLFDPSDDDTEGDVTGSGGERLQKVLAASGLGSRRHCEEYITTGRVTIDGKVVTDLGVKVDLSWQKVTVDGEKLKATPKLHFVLNKPPGYLCTSKDPGGRRRVIDLFPPDMPRLFTVGRLDENTEGLLVVTNDGELAQRLAHPKYRIPRIYRALVAGDPSPETIAQLRKGMYFEEGRMRFDDVSKVKTKGQASILEIRMREGQNREIRRLLARVGHKVMKLKRIAFGGLKLGELELGAYRRLSPKEIVALQDSSVTETRKGSPTKGRKPLKKKPGMGGAAGPARGPVEEGNESGSGDFQRPAKGIKKKAFGKASATGFGGQRSGPKVAGAAGAIKKAALGKRVLKKPLRGDTLIVPEVSADEGQRGVRGSAWKQRDDVGQRPRKTAGGGGVELNEERRRPGKRVGAGPKGDGGPNGGLGQEPKGKRAGGGKLSFGGKKGAKRTGKRTR